MSDCRPDRRPTGSLSGAAEAAPSRPASTETNTKIDTSQNKVANIAFLIDLNFQG